MIRVENVHKSFKDVRAVRGVSFEAPDGKITGLLGPNGAGKSTTLRILYTVLKPDEGRAEIDGVDVVADSLYRTARDCIRNSRHARTSPITRDSAVWNETASTNAWSTSSSCSRSATLPTAAAKVFPRASAPRLRWREA